MEADRLVAHDADAAVHGGRSSAQQGGLRGAVRGAVSGQGMFTTQLHGFGSVAVLSHGGTIALPVRRRPADHGRPAGLRRATSGSVDVDISPSRSSWRDAVGRGSGEAIQLKLTGSGTVYVQASEQKI